MTNFLVKNFNDSGADSLRQAVINAEASAGADTITFQSGMSGTINLVGTGLILTQDIAIDGDTDGDDVADITVSGGGAVRVFEFDNSANSVSLDSLVITGGNAAGGFGGGIYSAASNLALNHVQVTGNSAGKGGGIYSTTNTSVTITDSTISSNNATGNGGGISAGGDLTISSSTISGNNAARGAGIHFGYFTSAGILTASNSTISGNIASDSGGGLIFYTQIVGSTLTNVTIANNGAGSYAGGVLNINQELVFRNSTVAGNSAALGGAGITSLGDGATHTRLANTVVAGNTGGAGDLGLYSGSTNSFTSLGHNFIGNGNSLLGGGSDQVGTSLSPLNAILGVLQNNGGAVQTMRPADNSRLVGAGSNALVLPGNTVDAHGGSRIFGTVDIGAFELQNVAPVGVNDSNASDAVVEASSAGAGDPSAAGNVLGNDTDTNIGDTKAVDGFRTGTEAAGGSLASVGTRTGTYGALTLNADGTYVYLLDNTDPDTNALLAGATVHDFFTYRVTDSLGLTDTAQLDIVVTGVNDAPVITSNGGTDQTSVDVAENMTAVTIFTSSDVDGPAATYSISGLDSALFSINASTGVLSFLVAPDFEAPTNGDGFYVVPVTVSDGTLSDTQTLVITVTNVAGHKITGDKTLADTINGAKPSGNAATGEEDTISGRGGNDTIKALGGNDSVKGGAGIDNLDGGAGARDLVDFSDMTKAVVLTLNGSKFATATVGGLADDKVKNFESVRGGKAGDTLTGDKLANLLNGGAGNDTLDGGKGNDTLLGGIGADHLTGGKGFDWFIFNAKLGSGNVDAIDYKLGQDALALDDAIFTALSGTLTHDQFYAHTGATKAHDGTDRIIYNLTTGDLYYDADGKSGPAKAVQFAHLDAKPQFFDEGDIFIL